MDRKKAQMQQIKEYLKELNLLVDPKDEEISKKIKRMIQKVEFFTRDKTIPNDFINQVLKKQDR